jgi:hypothetical protein
VFDIDVLASPECGGRLRVIAYIAQTEATKRLAATGPPATPARRPPDPVDPAPDYGHGDATYDP